MINRNFSNLTDKILIATPFTMEGNVFHKSLIYVIKHSEEGSIGLIFNRPVKSAFANSLFNKQNSNSDLSNLRLSIHIGGPMEVERGFFLHTNDYDKNLLFNNNEGQLAVSSNLQIIEDMASGMGPKNSIFIVGYTGWGPSQLEFELENNLWIIADPDSELMFSEGENDKWTRALGALGVSGNYFIPSAATS